MPRFRGRNILTSRGALTRNTAWEKAVGYLAYCWSAIALTISQEASIGSTFIRFNLTDAITVATPLMPGTPPSTTDCPTSKDEIEEMVNRSYRGLVGAFAWLVLGTRPDVAFAPSELARFGNNPVGRG